MSSRRPSPAVKITSFPLPPASTTTAIVITGITMALSARPSLLQPGSLLHDGILSVSSPQAITAARWVQTGMFWFLFGAHTLEAASFAFLRLRRHGVPILSVLGLKWLAAVFVGGNFTWVHFDKVVAQKALSGKR